MGIISARCYKAPLCDGAKVGKNNRNIMGYLLGYQKKIPPAKTRGINLNLKIRIL